MLLLPAAAIETFASARLTARLAPAIAVATGPIPAHSVPSASVLVEAEGACVAELHGTVFVDALQFVATNSLRHCPLQL